MENFEYYAMSKGGRMSYFEPTKKSLPIVFGDDKDKISLYIKENKVKFKYVSDIIRIFEYYDSI